ncbi:hypothetical protein DSO57_1029088 [Entomophthora muscae]|uniref:Uncharacterized protein n=1 Tax=Entomophthora muscae TaxID=34485 RepID=A0ACC2RGC4_9FUNG|nr:hypothetical protein DSO57_1029088 [Entomophthora muscae]
MTANLSKCGSFSKNSRFPAPFSGVVINSQLCSLTHILYFLTTPDRMNFAQLTLEKCTKVTFSLTSMFGFADHWPAIVRISVYCTFFAASWTMDFSFFA